MFIRVRMLPVAAFCVLVIGVSQALEQPTSRPIWSGTAYNDAVEITGAERLHALGITGQGLTTAIIDAGFYTDHELFDGKIVNGYADPEDDHGTHVAGIALSMAPDSNLWFGALPDATDEDASSMFAQLAADAARYNIFAVNNSWGDPLEGGYANSREVVDANPRTFAAVRDLMARGMAVIASSGNFGVNDHVSFMEGLPNALSVGALNQFGYIANFSTQYRKDGMFLLAPGENIFSATTTAGGTSDYGRETGTSMAAPHVTGAITLLKSGARAAGAEEIIAALYDSAMPIHYDNDAVIKREHVPSTYSLEEVTDIRDFLISRPSTHPSFTNYTDWLTSFIARNAADAFTANEWRILTHIISVWNYYLDPNDPAGAWDSDISDAFAEALDETGGFNQLQYANFGLMQVDAAYRLLTARRAARMADAASATGSSHTEALSAFSREMNAYLDQNLVDLFQRLDGQPGEVLVRAARQLGPGWTASTMHSSVFGMLGLHGAAGWRLTQFRGDDRTPETAAAPEGLMSLTLPGRWTLWGEGFGGYTRRSETANGSGYHGSFAGVMAGMEKRGGDTLAGGFAAWANHNIDGDGESRGNWGTLGFYGGVFRDALSAGLSLSAGVGDYGLTRGVDGPAASLPGMAYAPIRVTARGDSRAVSLSARATAEWTLLERDGWKAGPGIEAAFAHSFMGGYTEHGGGGINLSVGRHSESYAEGGVSIGASRTFSCADCGLPRFTAGARLAGLYGGSFGGGMDARFAGGGAAFTVSPERIKSWWFVPEATLSWRATERVTVSASYQGRFGKHASTNTGYVSVGLDW